MTLVASALAGGDCIDDADVLRTGGTARAIGCVAKPHPPWGRSCAASGGATSATGPGEPRVAGSGLGRWGRTRRRAPGHRPGLHHLRDLRTGQGGRPAPRLHRSTGLSPVLAVAAGTGDVVLSRLREGRANTARGAAHFLRETVGRVRYAGATGQLTLRADSGFYVHSNRRRLPPDEGPLLHHHPPAPNPAPSHRGHTRGGLDAASLLDGRRR